MQMASSKFIKMVSNYVFVGIRFLKFCKVSQHEVLAHDSVSEASSNTIACRRKLRDYDFNPLDFCEACMHLRVAYLPIPNNSTRFLFAIDRLLSLHAEPPSMLCANSVVHAHAPARLCLEFPPFPTQLRPSATSSKPNTFRTAILLRSTRSFLDPEVRSVSIGIPLLSLFG